MSSIIYTNVDEAPALATYSFLPIVKNFSGVSGVSIETRDISLSGRIIATFSEYLTDAQKQNDDLAELGTLTASPEANIIKLPNISASMPQLNAAIKELQSKGYNLPNYPDEPKTDEEKEIKNRYDKIKGSAVNPVLREGNSDRRAPMCVKDFARKNPHKMGSWTADSKSHVAHMNTGDFYANEKSVTVKDACDIKIEFVSKSNEVIVLKEKLSLKAGEIIDATLMSVKALRVFIEAEIDNAKKTGCFVFGSHESNHDESFRSGYFRAFCNGFL